MRNTNLASLVRCLTFTCYVPRRLRTAFRSTVVDILDRCADATHLSFGPTFAQRTDNPEEELGAPYDDVLAGMIKHTYARLTNFAIHDFVDTEFGSCDGIPGPIEALAPFTSLVSLEVPLCWAFRDCPTDEATLQFCLGSLEEITFRHYDLTGLLPEQDEEWPWHFPHLRRVSVVDYERYRTDPYESRGLISRLYSFLQAHKETIRDLCFSAHCETQRHSKGPGLSLILGPRIEYLAFPLRWRAAASDVFKQLDSWSTETDPPHIDIWAKGKQGVKFLFREVTSNSGLGDKNAATRTLQLRPNVRILDPMLTDYPNIAHFLPPGRLQHDSPPIVHNLFGLQIVETSFAIFRLGSQSGSMWLDTTQSGQAAEDATQRPAKILLRKWSSGSIDFGTEGYLNYAVFRDGLWNDGDDSDEGDSETTSIAERAIEDARKDHTDPVAPVRAKERESTPEKDIGSGEEWQTDSDESDSTYMHSPDSEDEESDLDDNPLLEEEEDRDSEEFDEMGEDEALQIVRDVAQRSIHWIDYAI
ncbi:hypothetical protein EIP91_005795 [Steccherinum ochraceum]|uniref:Uncharacterized protein n=1 Tax=Steccherinum ochraceum TaxID=92696 RepID=A0A4R0RF36_9APHY|nr:hypothetical protein EIP91_005795 [Steccherinum ochraceum]